MKTRWVSVKERMPPKKGIYNCKVDIGAINITKSEGRYSLSNINIEHGATKVSDWVYMSHWQEEYEPE